MHNVTIAQEHPAIISPTRKVPLSRNPMRLPALARRVTGGVMEALMLLAVVLAVPLVILAVGIPIALVLQFLLWVGRQL